ncbi:MAG: 30S ribosomal protein S9 [Bacteroidetes bacterium]|nr:30S ribosomal protein S9 [Bacteroidota bacterium]MBS4061807.1 30S ribosomal protein S9 [Bacteroidota bacterium]
MVKMEVINTLGRRKTAVARIYMKAGTGSIVINKRDYKEYFPTAILHFVVEQPMALTDNLGKYDLKVNLAGGGINGQAEALSLAISRALCEINPEFRPVLKAKGLLRRDPRMVERKKPGQPKARKKFQFSKR